MKYVLVAAISNRVCRFIQASRRSNVRKSPLVNGYNYCSMALSGCARIVPIRIRVLVTGNSTLTRNDSGIAHQTRPKSRFRRSEAQSSLGSAVVAQKRSRRSEAQSSLKTKISMSLCRIGGNHFASILFAIRNLNRRRKICTEQGKRVYLQSSGALAKKPEATTKTVWAARVSVVIQARPPFSNNSKPPYSNWASNSIRRHKHTINLFILY